MTLFPWLLERNRQVFYPIKLWSALQVAMVVPGAFLVLRKPEYLHPDVLRACTNGVPSALAEALLVYTLCNSFVYLAYYALSGRRHRTANFFVASPSLGRMDSLFVVGVLLAFGIVGFAYKISTIGGVTFLFENVSRRVELQRGLGPLNYFIEISMWLALLISVRRFAIRGKQAELALCLIVFAVAAVSSTIFGGRKFTLQLAVGALMFYSLYKPNFMTFGFKTLVILAGAYSALVIYFFAILFYRNTNDIDSVVTNIPALVDLTMLSFTELLMSISYVDVYIFIVAHFDSSNFLGGATFNDLATAFVPSALLPDKPPVDEGLYVRYATLGVAVDPGTPANLLTEYGSWPPETVGTAYMNGGIAFVMASSILLGAILAFGFRFASKNPNSLVWLFVLGNLVLNFEISNLRITNLITGTVFVLLVVFIVKSAAVLFVPKKGLARRRLR